LERQQQSKESPNRRTRQWCALLLIDREDHLAPPPLVRLLMMHEQAGDTKWKAESAFRTTDRLVELLRTEQCTFPDQILLNECIGDLSLVGKSVTSALATLTCPDSRLYDNLLRI
jgi:hypothetical protein